MSTNIRIGGRTYRDVEKMNLADLQKVAMALAKELDRLRKTPVNSANLRIVQNQTEIITKRFPFIERLIKLKQSEENKDKA